MFSKIIAFPGSISRLREKTASASRGRPPRVGDPQRVQRVERRLGGDGLLQERHCLRKPARFAEIRAERPPPSFLVQCAAKEGLCR
jgi:hypothetical protein